MVALFKKKSYAFVALDICLYLRMDKLCKNLMAYFFS